MVAFFILQKIERTMDIYFTDTPELRMFEREMKQKPNFDRHRDEKNKDPQSYSERKFDVNRNKDNEG